MALVLPIRETYFLEDTSQVGNRWTLGFWTGRKKYIDQHRKIFDRRGTLGLVITSQIRTKMKAHGASGFALKPWRSRNRGVRSLTHFHAQSLEADSWCGSAGGEGGSSASVPGFLCLCLPPPLPPLLGTGSSCCTSLVQWQQSRTLRCWSGHSPGGRKHQRSCLAKG